MNHKPYNSTSSKTSCLKVLNSLKNFFFNHQKHVEKETFPDHQNFSACFASGLRELYIPTSLNLKLARPYSIHPIDCQVPVSRVDSLMDVSNSNFWWWMVILCWEPRNMGKFPWVYWSAPLGNKFSVRLNGCCCSCGPCGCKFAVGKRTCFWRNVASFSCFFSSVGFFTFPGKKKDLPPTYTSLFFCFFVAWVRELGH